MRIAEEIVTSINNSSNSSISNNSGRVAAIEGNL